MQLNNKISTINKIQGYWTYKQVSAYLGYNSIKTFYNDLPLHFKQGLQQPLLMPVGEKVRKVFKIQDVIDYTDSILVNLNR